MDAQAFVIQAQARIDEALRESQELLGKLNGASETSARLAAAAMSAINLSGYLKGGSE